MRSKRRVKIVEAALVALSGKLLFSRSFLRRRLVGTTGKSSRALLLAVPTLCHSTLHPTAIHTTLADGDRFRRQLNLRALRYAVARATKSREAWCLSVDLGVISRSITSHMEAKSGESQPRERTASERGRVDSLTLKGSQATRRSPTYRDQSRRARSSGFSLGEPRTHGCERSDSTAPWTNL